jgi:hypothetical protein
MKGGSRQSRRFGVFLLAASLLHAAVLLIPVVRQAVMEPYLAPTVSIRLQPRASSPRHEPDRPAQEDQQRPPRPMAEARPPEQVASEPPGEEITRREPPPEPAPAVDEPQQPVITAHRIISDLVEARARDPLALLENETTRQTRFEVPIGRSLDEVLNAPSLQLPFHDRRIYLVDSYAPGIGGSIDRFFDSVTVPFGFQTKNNTRIQCAWILVLAGCAWGDASLFYAADRARKRTPASE